MGKVITKKIQKNLQKSKIEPEINKKNDHKNWKNKNGHQILKWIVITKQMAKCTKKEMIANFFYCYA